MWHKDRTIRPYEEIQNFLDITGLQENPSRWQEFQDNLHLMGLLSDQTSILIMQKEFSKTPEIKILKVCEVEVTK